MLFNRSLPRRLLIFLLLTPLRLNSSDSKTNLPKYTTLHSIPPTAPNLGFIFDEHLTFSDQITSLSKTCYCHIRQLIYLSSTPNLITVILSTINSLISQLSLLTAFAFPLFIHFLVFCSLLLFQPRKSFDILALYKSDYYYYYYYSGPYHRRVPWRLYVLYCCQR